MSLRSLGPGQGLVPSTEGAPTQIVLAFDDNRHASVLFGQYGQNLALVERRLGVVAEQRGNHVTIDGSRDAVEQARVESLGSRAVDQCAHQRLPGALSALIGTHVHRMFDGVPVPVVRPPRPVGGVADDLPAERRADGVDVVVLELAAELL